MGASYYFSREAAKDQIEVVVEVPMHKLRSYRDLGGEHDVLPWSR